MKTYDDLKEEFDNKVANLRKECPHANLSGWTVEWWAMGHATGYEVQYCEDCNENIHRRTGCHKCKKTVQDDEIKKGDGSCMELAGGMTFCQECFDKVRPLDSTLNKEES